MDAKEKAGNLLPIIVTEGITVNVLPSMAHEYFMTSKEVANGYGISEHTLRRHKMEQNAELIDGRHFVTAVQILNSTQQGALKIPHNSTLWTKRGVVRLGFFIKSERAKLFRDWAEELVIKVDELAKQGAIPVSEKSLPVKRAYNGNRLTQERMIAILTDVCRISDDNLRISITNKLMGVN